MSEQRETPENNEQDEFDTLVGSQHQGQDNPPPRRLKAVWKFESAADLATSVIGVQPLPAPPGLVSRLRERFSN